jgi:ribosomal protein S18 acetylase RimI-like enzyme
MPVEIRPFRRSDRDQMTALVNAHIAAVVPGASVSVQTLLSQLEREPGEFIVDPWVEARATIVAVQRDRVVAAAHLLRYRRDERVGDSYRDVGEIRWSVHWPSASFWPDAPAAAATLATTCVAQLDRWQVHRMYADGALPALGIYGIPEQWPHVRKTLEDAGFRHTGDTEIVFVAAVAALPKPSRPPLDDVLATRSLGESGTRISAVRAGEVLGFLELDTLHDAGSRASRFGGWADVGNLVVREPYRRHRIGTWLLGQGRHWLELAGVAHLLAYANETDEETQALLAATGFEVLTRTARGFQRHRVGTP